MIVEISISVIPVPWWVKVIPFSDYDSFNADPLAISDSGQIFYSVNGMIRAFHDPELTEEISRALEKIDIRNKDNRLRLMTMFSESELLCVINDQLVSIELGKGARIIQRRIREEDPDQLPFRGGNNLFDIAATASRRVLAYYGNRVVLDVSDKEVDEIYHSEPPWSPHGVDLFGDSLYILESTTPSPAWEFWRDGELIPRIRVLEKSGKINDLYRHNSGD